jgi:hypothetical protein
LVKKLCRTGRHTGQGDDPYVGVGEPADQLIECCFPDVYEHDAPLHTIDLPAVLQRLLAMQFARLRWQEGE